jgi:hypothetical protein
MSRTHEVGRYGEMIVREALERMGLPCRGLGSTYPCFDILAENGRQKRLMAVKTRLDTRFNGTPKVDAYNLLCRGKAGDPMAQVRAAFEDAHGQNAEPWWAAVTLDALRQSCTIRCGRIDDLANPRYIDFNVRCERGNIIAEIEFDSRIKAAWSNVRKPH